MPGTGKEGSAAYFSSLSPPRFCVVETDKNGMALFASFLLEDAPTRSPLREIGSKDRLFAICDAPDKAPDVDFFARLPVGFNSNETARSSVSLI